MSRHMMRDRSAAVFGAIVRRRATLGRVFARKAIKSRCSALAVSSAGLVPTGRYFSEIKTLIRRSGPAVGASSRAEPQSPIVIRIDSSRTSAQLDAAESGTGTNLGIGSMREPIKPWAPGRSAHRRHRSVRIIRRAPATEQGEASTKASPDPLESALAKKPRTKRGRKPRVKKVKVIRINSYRPMDGIDPVTGRLTNFLNRERPSKQKSKSLGARQALNLGAAIRPRVRRIRRSARRGVVAGHRLAGPGKRWIQQAQSFRLRPRSLALPIRVLAKMRRVMRVAPETPVRHAPEPLVQPEATQKTPTIPQVKPSKPSREKPAASLVTRLKALDEQEDTRDVFSRSPTDLAPMRVEESLPPDETSPIDALASRFKDVGRLANPDPISGMVANEDATPPFLRRVVAQVRAVKTRIGSRLSSLRAVRYSDEGDTESDGSRDHGRAPHDADKAHIALSRWFELGPQVAKVRVPRS